MVPGHYTVGEVAALYGLQGYKIRRAADALGQKIPRAAGYRMIPRSMLPALTLELQRRGWLERAEEVAT